MCDAIDQSVGHALAQLCKAHRYAVDSALRALPRHELRVGQEQLLLQLWAADGISQSQLVERLCVEPPTVTRMLQRIEADGLVERRPDREDARISRVYLTTKGRALEAEVVAAWAAVEARATAGLSADEQALLRRLLNHMRENLAEA
ncbi:MAG TPA: MarR family transcriptional regulator [Chloroflexaceae bacterium]|nr:MarR family transcriptional regulator [Chloroflexaceae bacterium]